MADVLELLVYVVGGSIAGVFTGLCPGVHVNTVAMLAVAFSITGKQELSLAVISMAVTHSIVDFVPSVLLGAPNSSEFLSVLPGHELLLKGKAMEAVNLSALGALFGGLGAILLGFAVSELAIQSAEVLQFSIPFILLAVLILMVFGEESRVQRKRAFLVALLSSLLGIIALSSATLASSNSSAFSSSSKMLFPLVTGFFGVSNLLHSIGKNSKIPKQKPFSGKTSRKLVFEGCGTGIIASALVSIIPSIGPSQAAFLLKHFVGSIKRESYLVLLGAVGTANTVFSYFVFFSTGKIRTGVAAAISELGAEQNILYIISAVFVSLGIGYFFSLYFSKKILCIVQKVNYSALSSGIAVFLSILVVLFSGTTGFLVFVTATAIGYYSIARGIKRINTMAFLMVPTILIYLNAF